MKMCKFTPCEFHHGSKIGKPEKLKIVRTGRDLGSISVALSSPGLPPREETFGAEERGLISPNENHVFAMFD